MWIKHGGDTLNIDADNDAAKDKRKWRKVIFDVRSSKKIRPSEEILSAEKKLISLE